MQQIESSLAQGALEARMAKKSFIPEEQLVDEVELAFSAEDESDLSGIQSKTIRDMVVVPTDWTVGTIIEQLRQENIDLSPRYQRRDAWTEAKKSRFIESLFLRLPVPQLVLAETSVGSYAIIDGKQRLLSLAQFALNGFVSEPLRLSGITLRPILNGKSFSEIRDDRNLREDFNAFYNTTIRTIVVRNWRDERLLYLLFLRLNQNSVSLSPQELRGALHPGKFVNFAELWSGNSRGMSLLFPKLPDFRMRDVEITIRFFGFQYFANEYSGNMKVFLDDTTSELNRRWNAKYREIEGRAASFDEALIAADEIFSGQAFRKFVPETERFERRINRAILDIVAYYFSIEEVRIASLKNKETVKNAFIQLCRTDMEFVSSVEKTTKSLGATFYRFDRWRSALASALGLNVKMPPLRQ